MNTLTARTSIAFFLMVLAGSSAFATDRTAVPEVVTDPLFDTISALDNAVFDAFNHCEQPEQLRKHASYFAGDVEFYHDTGGVTWTRQDMLANTEKNACGHYRRELVAGSLKVYPIKGYGAIAQGVHRFCQVSTGACEGMADFVVVWHDHDGQWQITRVLSFGHRANPSPAK